MTIAQLIQQLQSGMYETIHDMHDFSDDPDMAVRPEYLKTIAIARTLKNAVGSAAVVRLEQVTSQTLGASVLPPHRQKGFSTLISRPGEVDIVISVEENGWKWPVIVVENKLYAAGYSTIEDDVIRCAEFVAAQGATGSIEVAAVTYFRRETQGVVISHQEKAGNRALDRIRDNAAALAALHGVQHLHERAVLISAGFTTGVEALSEDEDGMPAYLTQTSHTVWGAVELFWRTRTPSRLTTLLYNPV